MPRRPNIIVTIADDQRFDTIRALGNSAIQTPNLDQMTRDGLAFTAAHHMGSMVPAVCAPSRAMLMTGRDLFQIPNAFEVSCAAGEDELLPLLPQLLRENGYHTYGIGKWHNGKSAFARSFDGGAEIFFGGMCDHDKVPIYDFDPSGEYPDRNQRIGNQFSTDLFADAATDFLENYDSEAPFFLFVAFTAPHDPRTPLTEYAALYPSENIELPPNFLPQHPFDNGELEIRDELLEAFPRTESAIRQHIADYYAMITHLDAGIGQIHQTLARLGLAENTLVIHTADHGLAVGQHGLMGKQNLYEHSIRVPLLLRGPKVPAGQTREALCYQHDLFPTLCEAGQVPVPPRTEFQSLWPLIENGEARTWETLFGAYRNCQRMVKDERYKWIEYAVGESRQTQLFDWQNDPFELENLANSAAHQGSRRAVELQAQWQRDDDEKWALRLGCAVALDA